MNEGSLKNKIFSGLFWQFSERILAEGVSFFVSVVLSRILMPNDYGIVALVLIFINIANIFVTSGFSTSLVQKRDADDTDFSTIFYCTLTISIIIYAVVFFSAPLISRFYRNDLLTPVLRVLGLKIILSSYNSVQHAYVERHMIFKRFFFSTLGGTVLSGVVGIAMALNGFGVWALVAQYLVNSVVDMSILIFTVRWYPKLKFSLTRAKSLMNFGWKVLVSDLSGVFFDQLRSLIVGRVFTPADLAFYNKGNSLPSMITINSTQTITAVMFPAIANIKDDVKRVKETTRRAVNILSYALSPLLFGMAATARPLVLLIFTEKWLPSVPFIQILSISSAIGVITALSVQSIKSMGRSDILLYLEVIKKPVFVILLIIGVKISLIAVAITMFVYTAYASFMNASQLRKIINYSYKEQAADFLMPMFFSAVMAVFVLLISVISPLPNLPTLIIQVIVGAAIYISISKILKLRAYEYLKSFIRDTLKR